MLPSALPLSSSITLPLLQKPHILAFSLRPLSKSHVCFTFSSSNENPIGEEARWLREEQRWLREEQRWLREESRWNAERQALLQEINTLKLRIQELERLNSLQGASVSETVASIAKLLQEALQKLGFYSGEEDIEYSSFSSGTERAVKTWQSTNGVPVGAITDISKVEQTVVTEEGVSKVEASQHRVFLLGENRWEEPSRLSGNSKRTVTKSTSANVATKCLSCRGEGRLLCMEWKCHMSSLNANSTCSVTSIHSLVRECDGTGEPNVEPQYRAMTNTFSAHKKLDRFWEWESSEMQFLEWVDEGSKCPYCEGLGYVTCDVCGGRTATAA
ncbi:UNVERIFIED_CONTAM: Protein disulfide isomerase pTAC5, chloroplastic [Sesamum indicum]